MRKFIRCDIKDTVTRKKMSIFYFGRLKMRNLKTNKTFKNYKFVQSSNYL